MSEWRNKSSAELMQARIEAVERETPTGNTRSTFEEENRILQFSVMEQNVRNLALELKARRRELAMAGRLKGKTLR